MKNKSSIYLLISIYCDKEEEGVFLYSFDQDANIFHSISSLKGISNPSYLAVSSYQDRIYAVSEEDNNTASATTIAFDKDQEKLQIINHQLTKGEAPCYIHQYKNMAVTANYGGGSMSLFSLNESGDLNPLTDFLQFENSGIDKERQDKSHIHCTLTSPDKKFLFVTDLGGDCIYRFTLKEDYWPDLSSMKVFDVKPGSGPRHLCFHPNGKFLYLINELSSSVIAFSYHEGNLDTIQTVDSDPFTPGGGGADIHISPDGRFLYSSNRLTKDGIAIFEINQENGRLEGREYQPTVIHPRNFVISPNGKYLLVAGKDDNMIQVFERDMEKGTLTDTGNKLSIKKPVCLKFM